MTYTFRASPRGIAFIQSFESCRLTAYKCPAGVWTIGWGHTGSEVKEGLVWTQKQADNAFWADVVKFESYVNQLITRPTTQGQFDALLSFAFNVGPDIDADTIAEGLGDSTLLLTFNAGNFGRAADEFLKWNKSRVNGVPTVIAGLTRRRTAERAMFVEKPTACLVS